MVKKVHYQDDLMNQEEDKNHVIWIIKLNSRGLAVVTERVVGTAENMKGSKFLQHTNLRSKYLKKDYQAMQLSLN